MKETHVLTMLECMNFRNDAIGWVDGLNDSGLHIDL